MYYDQDRLLTEINNTQLNLFNSIKTGQEGILNRIKCYNIMERHAVVWTVTKSDIFYIRDRLYHNTATNKLAAC